jgi:hypothetical protein
LIRELLPILRFPLGAVVVATSPNMTEGTAIVALGHGAELDFLLMPS